MSNDSLHRPNTNSFRLAEMTIQRGVVENNVLYPIAKVHSLLYWLAEKMNIKFENNEIIFSDLSSDTG